MMRSMSSMSDVIPVFSCGSAPAISSPRRRRASGVRRSCDTPASTSARSSSRRARSRAIWLKARETVWISAGPDSSSGAGIRPRPMSAAARVSAASGRRTRNTTTKRAGERERCGQDRPAEPLQREPPLHPLARQHHPVLVVLDAEADPERLDALALERDPGLVAELAADLGDRQPQAPAGRRAAR